jgi:hypothetical protein
MAKGLSVIARTRRTTRRPLLAATIVLTSFLATPASAITVTYDWVPDPGQLGSGTLTFSDPGIVDPENFSAIPLSALTALSYTWDNGVSINLASVTSNTAPSWTACGGYLITGFTMSALSPVQFQLANPAGSCFPNFPNPGDITVIPGLASNNIQSNGIYPSEINAGHWQFGAIVPVPAAVWLFGSAVGLLGWLRRKSA